MLHEPACQAAAASLTAGFAAKDVFFTRGASGAIALALNTVVDSGDKVVFLSPPGYFRISLTATDEMVERSLPVFARAIEQARSGPRASRSARVVPHTGR
jgi:histidinol-phosphate/aromatic aminotransferase/cobyric acid decarboxylase-like protein